MENGKATVKLLGIDHAISLPPFAEREDIAISYSTESKHPRRQSRALTAALGLCVPEYSMGGVSLLEDLDFDIVKYGGRVYSAAMARGVKREDILTASVECYRVVCESLFPRAEAVDKAEVFTDPAAEAAT